MALTEPLPAAAEAGTVRKPEPAEPQLVRVQVIDFDEILFVVGQFLIFFQIRGQIKGNGSISAPVHKPFPGFVKRRGAELAACHDMDQQVGSFVTAQAVQNRGRIVLLQHAPAHIGCRQSDAGKQVLQPRVEQVLPQELMPVRHRCPQLFPARLKILPVLQQERGTDFLRQTAEGALFRCPIG